MLDSGFSLCDSSLIARHMFLWFASSFFIVNQWITLNVLAELGSGAFNLEASLDGSAKELLDKIGARTVSVVSIVNRLRMAAYAYAYALIGASLTILTLYRTS